MVKEVIILAGGLGTRLRKVIKDIPKPMADIDGKPFLEYLLYFLSKQGMERVILSVGYKSEVIMKYFGNSFLGMELLYSVEMEPLGTGGAIKKSLTFAKNNDVFIVNGDTFFKIDLNLFFLFYRRKQTVLSVALRPMRNFDRYGIVMLDRDKRIIGFREKKYHKIGLINAGTYLLNKNYFLSLSLPEKFSFEKDFIERYYTELPFYGFEHNGYFIDIGIPEDYEECKRMLKKVLV